MASVLPAFNNERVLRDYVSGFYAPAGMHGRTLAANDYRAARDLGEWKARVRGAWSGVALKLLGTATTEVAVKERVSLDVEVALNGLTPGDVRVECIVRRVLGSDLVVPVQGYAENRRWQPGISYLEGHAVLVEVFVPGAVDASGSCKYRLEFLPPWSGTLQYEIRAVPQHQQLSHPYELGLMRKL
jgi:starch phosphorylase